MFIFDSDIKSNGMCKEIPEEQCHSSCSKFMKGECPGMRYIRAAGGNTWVDQRRYPFPLWKKMNKKKLIVITGEKGLGMTYTNIELAEVKGCPHCGSLTKHKKSCPDQQIINAFNDLKEAEQ